ncbi:hypothetical protein ABZ369_29325, partial [Streptomyces sp. NPDC005918]
MQLRRRKGAAAVGVAVAVNVAVAVIAGALGGAPGALAAPGPPGPPGRSDAPVASPDPGPRTGLPAVWPRPQSMSAAGDAVTVGDDVVLVAPEEADHDRGERLERVHAGLTDDGRHRTERADRG